VRHKKTVKKLGRPTDQRMALLRGLVGLLFMEGFVDTTLARAKSAQRIAEKVICMARRGRLADYRRLAKFIYGKKPFKALKDEVIPSLPADKSTGFTKVVRIKRRRGDGAVIARLFIPTHPKLIKRLQEEE